MEGIKATSAINKAMTDFSKNLQDHEAYWQDSYHKVGSDEALTIPMPEPIRAQQLDGISSNEQAFIQALDGEYQKNVTALNEKVASSLQGKISQSYVELGSKMLGMTLKGFNQLLQGG